VRAPEGRQETARWTVSRADCPEAQAGGQGGCRDREGCSQDAPDRREGATRPPEGGAERSEIFRWKISAQHARPVAAPGVRARPYLTGVKSSERASSAADDYSLKVAMRIFKVGPSSSHKPLGKVLKTHHQMKRIMIMMSNFANVIVPSFHSQDGGQFLTNGVIAFREKSVMSHCIAQLIQIGSKETSRHQVFPDHQKNKYRRA
jgi:hypothetical protein